MQLLVTIPKEKYKSIIAKRHKVKGFFCLHALWNERVLVFIEARMKLLDKQWAYAKIGKRTMSGKGRVKVLTFSMINRTAKWAFREK